MSTSEGGKDQRKPRRTLRASIVEAHNVYVKYHHDLPATERQQGGVGHRPSLYEDVLTDGSEGGAPSSDPLVPKSADFAMIQRVEKTGVIYATKRAKSNGFSPADPTWANMGQGAPETGPIEGAPKRSFNLTSMFFLFEERCLASRR